MYSAHRITILSELSLSESEQHSRTNLTLQVLKHPIIYHQNAYVLEPHELTKKDKKVNDTGYKHVL